MLKTDGKANSSTQRFGPHRLLPGRLRSEEAEIFMQAIMGLKLWESDGVGRGETKGEIVGYNTINGSNYGGSDEPLPPGARAVFAIFKDGWQTVPATKGKRARDS